MKHSRIQAELSAYLDDELTPRKREQVEAHLRACDASARLFETLKKNRQRVANIKRTAPPTLKTGVMAKIHAQIQDEVSAYLDNELAPADRERLEVHLQSCSDCTEMLSAFQQNGERLKVAMHPAPASIQEGVMTKIRQQAAKTQQQATPVPSRLKQWIPDVGRWFFRPITAGATGVLTLVLILGALYFYPTESEYEETLDFYFGIHAEQLTDSTLESNIGSSSLENVTPSEDAVSTETTDDTELFLDLYLEGVGN